MTRKSIKVAAAPDVNLPEFSADLGRVNVIMGANGSGKSRLLIHLAQNYRSYFGDSYLPVLVEGSRRLNFDVTVGDQRGVTSYYGNPDAAKAAYNETKKSSLDGRLRSAFKVMRAMEFSEKGRHSDAVHAWQKSGGIGAPPARQRMPFEVLFDLFREIFTHLQLEITESHQLYVRNGQAHYPILALSDGEQQVLAFLADLLALDGGRSVFFVDEPELRLHPKLAERLWDVIESKYHDSIFVYATHSVSFALRKASDTVHVLGHGVIDLQRMDSSTDVLAPFLGSLPGIIRNRRCLLVEGGDTSFDREFYAWLVAGLDVEVTPVGSATAVRTAVGRAGVWGQVDRLIRIAGVIDLDFETKMQTSQQEMLTLSLHEAESYLCHPDLAIALSEQLANKEKAPSREEIIDEIVEFARTRLPYTVAQRCLAKLRIELRPSIEAGQHARTASVEQLIDAFKTAAQDEHRKSVTIFDAAAIEDLVSTEWSNCSQVIDSRNVEQLLQVYEGKSLLERVARKVGCESARAMLKATTKHLDPKMFRHTAALSDSLREQFS